MQHARVACGKIHSNRLTVTVRAAKEKFRKSVINTVTASGPVSCVGGSVFGEGAIHTVS